MKLTLDIEIPDNYSGETIEQTRKALGVAAEYVAVFAAKQEAYGRQNIAVFGERGVVIRLHDKLQRLINLVFHGRANDNEAVRDTWLDALGYGLIGLLCHDDRW